MNKILIISDNATLTSFFIKAIKKHNLHESVNLSIRHSARNSSPKEMISLDSLPIDLKDSESIDWIVNNFNLVISIHCKQIFPSNLVKKVTCINIHPGYNPDNRGWYPQVFSIINKKKIGATIHYMNKDIDSGDIIIQRQIAIDSDDTSLSLYNKVQTLEKELIDEKIEDIIFQKAKGIPPINQGNYNSIQDFKNLCSLDLNNIATLEEHIDLLRALSHGEFRNAFFIDRNGDKVYVSINLEKYNNE